MFKITVWLIWSVFIAIGLGTGLIATSPMRWQERFAFVGASVVAFIVAMVWAAHFSL